MPSMPVNRVRAAALTCLLLTGLPALAAPPKGKEEASGSADSDKEIARSIELAGLVFPVFDAEGRLQNYIFVNGRLLVANGKDPWKYREKGHFIRDAVLRAAHRNSFHMKDNYTKLDERFAAAECVRAANEAVGEKDALVSMTFTQIASQVGR